MYTKQLVYCVYKAQRDPNIELVEQHRAERLNGVAGGRQGRH